MPRFCGMSIFFKNKSMKRVEIATRLVEERARLGLSQADMARQLDVSREGLRRYEGGLSEVGAEFLSNASSLGMDVQYVLCGLRSNNSERSQPMQSINGGVSGVGIAQSGANISIINSPKVVHKTVVNKHAGEEHISEDQCVTLKGMVSEVVTTEAKLKKKPKTYPAVWGALNAHMRVSQYALIPREHFEVARGYLNQWLGRLNSAKSAPIDNADGWRKRRYAYIKINTREPEHEVALSKYLQKNFKTVHLTDLANEQLEQVYKYVAGRRNKRL